jgi:hypothetical protein
LGTLQWPKSMDTCTRFSVAISFMTITVLLGWRTVSLHDSCTQRIVLVWWILDAVPWTRTILSERPSSVGRMQTSKKTEILPSPLIASRKQWETKMVATRGIQEVFDSRDPPMVKHLGDTKLPTDKQETWYDTGYTLHEELKGVVNIGTLLMGYVSRPVVEQICRCGAQTRWSGYLSPTLDINKFELICILVAASSWDHADTISPLRHEIHLNNIWRFSSSVTENALRLHFKGKSANAV